MKFLEQVRHTLADNQILIVFAALIMGIFFPTQLKPLAPFSTPFLVLIFFTSSLRLGLHELLNYAKDWKMLALANFVKAIFMPIVMWIPLALFAPDWALPFLIVGAVPTGLTIALIADLFGGKTSLAMLVSATSSLISPLTVPLVFLLVIGQSVPIPVVSLFSSLFLTIVVPFIVAMLVKSKAKKFVERHDLLWREVSLILFGLLIAGIVADTVEGAPLQLGWNEIGIVVVMMVFMGGIAWLAYAITAWRIPAERITIALCMVYMNNTLALYIGDRFFHEQHVVPKLLVILTAVNALLPPIKWAAGRVIKTSAKQKAASVAQPVI
jgi:BASS family bile acid:Na+ symporter